MLEEIWERIHFFWKMNYSVISFEASIVNYYVLKMNNCLLNLSNAIITNKGLYTEEKKCNYWSGIKNLTNGMVLCGKNKMNIKHEGFSKTGEVILTIIILT